MSKKAEFFKKGNAFLVMINTFAKNQGNRGGHISQVRQSYNKLLLNN